MGATFRNWLAELISLGYTVEFKSLVAADYGTPSTRRRLFLVARCDGAPIVWPTITHGRGRAQPWRGAAEIIDWTLSVPSIFERKRSLADATLRRIAQGIRRYVLTASQPFIVPLTHHGSRAPAHSLGEPLRTVTAAHRGELALVEPFLVRHGHYSTVSGAGLREGCGAGTFRGQVLGQPLGTVCATNDKHLVAPLITKHYGGVVGHAIDRALGTVTGRDHHALSAAFLTKFYGTCVGAALDSPVPTSPVPAITANNRGGGHLAQVQALLHKHHAGERRSSGQVELELLEPVPPETGGGIVMVHGEPYQIVDIGMRMLQPRELFRAQGFHDHYVIDPIHNGKPLTKTAQIALAGNSVCPQVAAALVASNATGALECIA